MTAARDVLIELPSSQGRVVLATPVQELKPTWPRPKQCAQALRYERAAAQVDGTPIDLVAFELLAGVDRNDQVTLWIRSGLRGGLHAAITLPLSPSEVTAHARSFS
jgi:hypothetical protein